MKRTILMLLFSMVVGLGYSQVTSMKHTTSNPTGALTGSTVDTMTIEKATGCAKIGFHVVVTRTSGTLAGTSILYKSNFAAGPWQPVDTLTLSNAAKVDKFVEVSQPVAQFWMYKTTGSGTMGATTACGMTMLKQ